MARWSSSPKVDYSYILFTPDQLRDVLKKTELIITSRGLENTPIQIELCISEEAANNPKYGYDYWWELIFPEDDDADNISLGKHIYGYGDDPFGEEVEGNG